MLLVAALGTSAVILLAALAGHPELLAYSAPLFLVAVPLIAGRYVGEEHLERLRTGLGARRRPLPTPLRVPRRRPAALVPRGGRLIAAALAERAPPALALS